MVDSPGEEPIPVTDGGGWERLPGTDPGETPFIWETTQERRAAREPDPDGAQGADGTSAAAGSPDAEYEAIRDRLDELTETVDHLSVLAMNANLKLARDEPGALADIADEVQADARALHRSIEDVESRVDRLRHQFRDSQRDRPGGDETEHRDAARLWGDGVDRFMVSRPGMASDVRSSGARSSVQLVGDREPNGPWRAAGVDLTDWPGHLARRDFERIREQVDRSETVATGRIPTDVAEFSVDDGELSVEALLSLATTSDRGQPNPTGAEATEAED